MSAKFSIQENDKPKKKGKAFLFEQSQEAGTAPENTSEGQKVSLPEGQTAGKKGPKYNNNPEFKKTTYYIRRDLERQLQLLSLSESKDLTELVNQAIEDFVHKSSR